MSIHGLSEPQLQRIKNVLAPFSSHIERVGLFGSRATGLYRANSDIDLVVYGVVDDTIMARLFTLFKESLLPFNVDIVAYNSSLYPPLKAHIDAVMHPLFTHQDLLEYA